MVRTAFASLAVTASLLAAPLAAQEASERELVWADDDEPAPLPKDPVPLLRILHDERYRSFNPVENRVQLDERLVQSTFSDLLEWFDNQLELGK